MLGITIADRYELIEKIGEGGMAVVFKAKDLKLQRIVALKILKEEYVKDADFVDKFKGEAMAAASISDSNIVGVYDVGTDDNINYIVMEYLSGKTLKEVINEKGKLYATDVIAMSIQIARALECAHNANIIHRDIKPHNIMVNEFGMVKVMDFGIAKAVSNQTITNTNVVLGSVHYISPEQAKGKYVDKRCDLYSLGAVMYEMITGVVPYDGDTPVSIAIKHIQDPVVSPKKINAEISDELNYIIEKLMKKDPALRYQSARNLCTDLLKLQSNTFRIPNESFDDEHTRILPQASINEVLENSKKEAETPKRRENANKEVSEEEKKAIRNKKIILGSVIGLGSVLLITLFYFFGTLLGGKKTKTVEIINVVGITKEEATRKLEDINLTVEVLELEDKSEKDKVFKTSPEAGTQVKEKSVVKIYVSKGEAKVKVPGVVGKDLNTAKNAIKDKGLEIGEVTEEYSDTVEQGLVIRASLEEGVEIEKGEKVDLVVSKGVETTEMSLLGYTVQDAQAKLAGIANIVVENEDIGSSPNHRHKDGQIIKQSTTTIKKGDTVRVTVLRYKEEEKIAEPEVIGLTVASAKAEIEKNGFKVGKIFDDVTKAVVQGSSNDYLVSSIKYDGEIAKGSVIDLYVTVPKSSATNPQVNP